MAYLTLLVLCSTFKYINYKGFGPSMVKLNPKIKGRKVGSWVCQCVQEITKLVLLCPCKFTREFLDCFVILAQNTQTNPME
jgi:hypothetical protein